jgi:hypothetical protein
MEFYEVPAAIFQIAYHLRFLRVLFSHQLACSLLGLVNVGRETECLLVTQLGFLDAFALVERV